MPPEHVLTVFSILATSDGGNMKPEKERRFSIQADLIREFQAESGDEPCYATPTAENCAKKKEEACRWRHDCFSEAEEESRRNKNTAI